MTVRLPPPFKLDPAARQRRGAGSARRWLLLLALLLGAAAGGWWWWRGRDAERRSHAYDRIIAEAARRNRLDPALVKAVVKQESDFRATAVGRIGEIGLMQITPGAIRDWERATGRSVHFRGQAFDPRLNIEIGAWYLGQAMRQWEQHPDQTILALAQYNAGVSRAREWSQGPAAEPLGRIRFRPTRHYIEQILEYQADYEQPPLP
ncbi:MAG: lytic transglycosylase domain-containing protein [Lentisphaeria bacterium]|jgi:soluble lytic murein transglycosylase